MIESASPKIWADAMAAFDAWAELPDAQRATWLGQLAAAQRELHERLAALIRADRDAEDRSFLNPGAAAAPAFIVSLEGQRLGPWHRQRPGRAAQRGQRRPVRGRGGQRLDPESAGRRREWPLLGAAALHAGVKSRPRERRELQDRQRDGLEPLKATGLVSTPG
jgi:hypothetical protein